MSQWNGNSHELQELAQLPPGDPRRASLEVQLQRMAPAERAYWIEQLMQTDQIYAEIQLVRPSASLEHRLLLIPDNIPRPALGRILHQPVGWSHWAAAMLSLIILAGIIVWHLSPPAPPRIPPLDGDKINQVSSMAVELRSAPVEFALSDSAALLAHLQRARLPFVPVVPRAGDNLKLEGGGVTLYHTMAIAVTKWSEAGEQFTLFQFDGSEFGIPLAFAITTWAVPHKPNVYVTVWPGAEGQGTWMLISKSAQAANIFTQSCR